MARALRILVVDDDDDLRVELVELLRAMHFHVAGYATASSARDRVADQDIVLCDLDLGAESGIDLIRHIVSLGASRPRVIAMSGRVDLLNLFDASGAIPMLSKPMKIASLIAAIKNHEARLDDR
ncbi:Response regulator receiver domain-containing protein [Sphingomonas guangdongensis]|uniref:Response regulator receiver domain-containing protein n=1 Tax=Sphingomonas guangdongensis TaxID=1141890 RepID=A0A285R2J2_9SPHN|nr:response regulator [Sphingomonas guangdongensis]SOB88311.1 Response regulator receiver domain-containing protein [Sphingomonas guangdongensis]